MFDLGRRGRPADPQAILQRRAEQRASERRSAGNPATWGISAEILALPTASDVGHRVGERKKIIWAKRSNAFDQLYAARRYDDDGRLRAGISEPQHKASQRYLADWCERYGVQTGDALPVVDHQADGQGAVQRMIDAGRRIDEAHKRIGRVSRRVLVTLAESMIVRGEIRVWRVLVQAASGETEAHAQGAAVRIACEDLRLAYDEVDGVTPAEEDSPRRSPVRLWYAPGVRQATG